jgi:putative addiction module component (TIGR02574 family)
MTNELSQLLELPPAQRLELVEALWDSLDNSLEDVPIPEWQKEELDRRKASSRDNPDAGMTWEEAKARITERRG